MQAIDTGVGKKFDTLKLDQSIKDWELELSTTHIMTISGKLKQGPLLLVFIRGTWFPFCRLHLKNLAL